MTPPKEVAPTNGSMRILDIMIRVLVPVLVAVNVWQLESMLKLNADMAVVKATRFTSADGQALERRIKSELPPKWLLDQIADLKLSMNDNFEEIKVRLTNLEQKP